LSSSHCWRLSHSSYISHNGIYSIYMCVSCCWSAHKAPMCISCMIESTHLGCWCCSLAKRGFLIKSSCVVKVTFGPRILSSQWSCLGKFVLKSSAWLTCWAVHLMDVPPISTHILHYKCYSILFIKLGAWQTSFILREWFQMASYWR
jgi:hypothetical protein